MRAAAAIAHFMNGLCNGLLGVGLVVAIAACYLLCPFVQAGWGKK